MADIRVTITGDKELIAKFGAMGAGIPARLVATIRRLGFELQAYVQSEKLSGQVLKVRTGTLRSSINTKIEETRTSATATVGTNVFYGAIQERGVPHSWLIEAKNAKALRFEIGGQAVFRRSAVHPPLPPRSFLVSALKDKEPYIRAEIEHAVAEELAR